MTSPPTIPPPLPMPAPAHRWPRPRVWTVFLVCVIASITVITLSAVTMLAFVALEGEWGTVSELERAIDRLLRSPPHMLANMAIYLTALGLIALAAGWLSPVPLVDRLRLQSSRASVLTLCITVIATLACSQLISALITLLGLADSPTLDFLFDLIGQMSPGMLIIGVLVIGLAPGIAEELLFRGYVQTRLTRRFGVITSILVASLLFGMFHLDLGQGLFALLIGLFLGYLTEKFGSIRPAILCHTANNMFSTLLVAAMPTEDIAGYDPLVTPIAAVVFALCMLYLVRLRTNPPPPEGLAAMPIGAPAASSYDAPMSQPEPAPRQMVNPPLKRHPSLQPLSRDHYGGLVQAQHLLRTADAPPEQRHQAIADFLNAWRTEISLHFADEERLLTGMMTSEQRQRLDQEHARLRQLATEAEAMQQHPEPDPQWLRTLGQTLNDHIRWEERELFPAIEAVATPEQIDRLTRETEAIEATRPRNARMES